MDITISGNPKTKTFCVIILLLSAVEQGTGATKEQDGGVSQKNNDHHQSWRSVRLLFKSWRSVKCVLKQNNGQKKDKIAVTTSRNKPPDMARMKAMLLLIKVTVGLL